MTTALDTNLLTRSVQPQHPMHQQAVDAIDALLRRGEALFVMPQNFYEFWVVATRPVAQNGLGLSVAEAQAALGSFKRFFTFAEDTPAIYPIWERLVAVHQVTGKTAHDTRLVAAMMAHGITIC